MKTEKTVIYKIQFFRDVKFWYQRVKMIEAKSGKEERKLQNIELKERKLKDK